MQLFMYHNIYLAYCGSLRLSPLSPPLPPLLPCESSFGPPLLLLLPAIHVARPLPGPMHVAPPGPSALVGPLPCLPVMRPLRANSSGGYVGRDARGKESKEREKGDEGQQQCQYVSFGIVALRNALIESVKRVFLVR